ncbi:NADP-dependent oxidoreductase [Actinopolymorpha alba]|uniref:NADP-dependent oxidoreductase n=1 Tax=Actinopolymorpha alba TaxID=533267 RepID=UPI00036484C4|nr:NADP-dependent oxidoreductase [Actinopolymorpha alba]
MKAVRFDEYGGTDVLYVADVPVTEPAQGQVLVKVRATSINPGETKIRQGLYRAIWPATFPSGEGTDLAGVVTEIGPGVEGVAAGDEVIGFTDERASHAEYVSVPAENLAAKPANVAWEVAGSLPVAGSTAYASVRAVSVEPGDTLAVSGAAGGVGSIVVQLARRAGAEVIGIAGPANHDWLAAHGVRPVTYGEGLADRLREAGIDAFIDTYGDGYVKLAIDLGVSPERIDTIVDFAAPEEYGVKAEGSASARNAAVLAELAGQVASGDLEVPIAATFPLDDVRAAFKQLERGHTRGKIVLLP